MDFKNIDKKYRPVPFWSWNEKLNVSESLRQTALMDEVGIGGYFMHARGGLQTEYMGEEWFENIGACIVRHCFIAFLSAAPHPFHLDCTRSPNL